MSKAGFEWTYEGVVPAQLGLGLSGSVFSAPCFVLQCVCHQLFQTNQAARRSSAVEGTPAVPRVLTRLPPVTRIGPRIIG
jgi:hypothetical protein